MKLYLTSVLMYFVGYLALTCVLPWDHVFHEEFHGRTDAKGIQDPKKVKHDRISSGLELGAPTVDEFGRLVRHDSSDSDGEDGHHGKKRRRSTSWSRSRSQSPREKLRQHRSHSQSRSRRFVFYQGHLEIKIKLTSNKVKMSF